MRNHRWSQGELDYLLANKDRQSVREIADHLGRSYNSVASYMTHNKIPKRQDYWTDAEIERLKYVYPTDITQVELLAMFPGRTRGTIKAMACSLGLYRKSKITVLDKLTEAEKGYLAGLIDGEGTISLLQHGANKSGEPYYRIRVRIANTDIKMVKWLTSKMGIWNVTLAKPYGVRKPVYQISCAGFYVLPLLKEIRKYLIIKQDIADKLMDGFKHLSKEERGRLHEWILTRNQKGNHIIQ